ncbi:Ran-binding protein 1 homolog b-like protein [Tanacetum coccineum]
MASTTERKGAVEDEDTRAHIAPIVKLDEVTVTTGDEDDDGPFFDLKAKLYRFDKDGTIGSVGLAAVQIGKVVSATDMNDFQAIELFSNISVGVYCENLNEVVTKDVRLVVLLIDTSLFTLITRMLRFAHASLGVHASDYCVFQAASIGAYASDPTKTQRLKFLASLAGKIHNIDQDIQQAEHEYDESRIVAELSSEMLLQEAFGIGAVRQYSNAY